ncbi:ROK family protein [Modestobacter marinus]|uniref:NagC family transcriptional regulator n=1 Tax=Modestobacter marinus TaxID=477641 RepID=A0A846LE60_9ACTN|nr:ROK family protein [Modestobacter marinus]NIH66433.1 putative NBD/HSP70 family sugar kinase [Modestobacter marinus]GGL63704.1 NagC family transcriptional regulator [Modestobacter marinus]
MTARSAGEGRCTVGLDVGGTKVLGVLLDDAATVRASVRVPSRPGTEGVVGAAAEVVTQLCRTAGLPPGELAGVGAGVPGLVDPLTGEVSHAVNLGIADEPVALAPLLADRLGGVPVTVENDLNVAAVGAARVLGLRGDLAFLSLGTGVAAGLLLGGELRRGHRGGAGEIGHIPYDPAGPRCPCGQRGCLELYASGAALGAAWPGRTGRPAAVELFAAAAGGDAAAVRVRDAFAGAVAAAVRLLVLTCDVEHVVLGGGVAEVGTPLMAAVAHQCRRQAAGSPFLDSLRIADRVQLVPAGVPVAPIGAALAVRDRVAADGRRPVPAPS